MLYALRESGGNTLTSYDAATKLEESLKFTIRNGFAGRVGNKNTHLYKSTKNTLADIINELSFVDGLFKDDQNLQKHISDLEKVKQTLENYLEIFIG